MTQRYEVSEILGSCHFMTIVFLVDRYAGHLVLLVYCKNLCHDGQLTGGRRLERFPWKTDKMREDWS